MADKGIAEKCSQESGYFTTNNARSSDAVAIVPSKQLFSVVVLCDQTTVLFVRVGRSQ